ncbi:hypothetical protein DFS34DRAFT_649448 [Phlyctochytrium arcticum]|nr:hypothetical protein DFS34DRAFT_649448 [Phlyctochytrium arcticum]
MKQRFSALDVSAQVSELKTKITGLRLQNVYDINPRTYLFKFARSDHKEIILIESGIRIHSTEFARDKSNTPSHFAMKLRKHLRTRRLTDLRQLGADRVLDMTFGQGEAAYHVIVEFYAQGNIILTDWEYRILALLRVVELEKAADPENKSGVPDEDEGDTKFAVGETYVTTRARDFQPITRNRIVDCLESAIQSESTGSNPVPDPSEEAKLVDSNDATSAKARKQQRIAKAQSAKKDKKSKESALRRALRSKFGPDYGPALLEHCIIQSGVDVDQPLAADMVHRPDSDVVEKLFNAFAAGDKIVQSCMERPQQGWISMELLSKPGSDATVKSVEVDGDAQDASTPVAYKDFHPFLPQQFALQKDSDKHRVTEYASFDKCVDEYYSKVEAQKLQIRSRQAEANASKKLESVKTGHMNQIRGLELVQEESVKVAQAIEANLALIDSLINTFRSFIASGMDWKDLEELVAEERKRGNAVANMVLRLKLETGMVTVQLRDADAEDSDDEEIDETDSGSDSEDDMLSAAKNKDSKKSSRTQSRDANPFVKADIDIYSSAYANARRYYESKKVAAVKQDKTVQAAEKAFKSAERKIEQEMKSTQKSAPVITKMRSPFWFEKFLWFISSENYLVVGGRDAQQNELLVKRYLKKGDVYVHAELHGAASVIIKNAASSHLDGTSTNSSEPPAISPTTLHQAGTMSVCQSRAWEAKIVTSAWWVWDHQVSKTAPTGEYLTTGSFMIRGKKNWLPPVQLVYGYGIMFRVDDESVGRHYWERRPWGRGVDSVIENGVAGPSRSDPAEANVELIKEDEIDGLAAVEGEATSAVPNSTTEQSEANAAPEDKYKLEDIGADEDEEELSVPEARPVSSGPAKKQISAKERRDTRKQRKTGASTSEDVQSSSLQAPPTHRDLDKVADDSFDGSGSVTASEVSQSQTHQQVRGKRGKIKKFKTKYADQDEEDRELMLEILGSNRGQQPKGKRAKAQAEAAKQQAELAKQQAARKEQQLKQAAQHKMQQAEKERREKVEQNQSAKQGQDTPLTQEPEDDSEGSDKESSDGDEKADRVRQPSTRRDSTATDAAEVRRILDEESVALVPDEEESNLSFLDTLTGQPHPSDILLFAIPMCAPWSALQKFKYKVKLTPGSLKKGKATKAALSALVGLAIEEERQIAGSKTGRRGGRSKPSENGVQPQQQQLTEEGQDEEADEQALRVGAIHRQRDLIKAIPEMEAVNAMLAKVKVMATEGGKKDGKKGR